MKVTQLLDLIRDGDAGALAANKLRYGVVIR